MALCQTWLVLLLTKLKHRTVIACSLYVVLLFLFLKCSLHNEPLVSSTQRSCDTSFNHESINYKFHKTIWQNLTTPQNENIYLYKAYYDDRPLHNGKIFTQILAAGAYPKYQAHAIFWTGGSIWHKATSNCSVAKHGRGHQIGELYFDQFFFSCEVPKMSAPPKFVSLTFNECKLEPNLITIHFPERERKHKFSICVETGYNHITPWQIVEWIEANQLMGVTKFSVYPCNMSDIDLRLFRQLETEGILDLTMMPSPLPETSWKNQMISSPASFNDCMMRQIYSAEYIIPLDFDEVIAPRNKATNYSSLLEEINQAVKPKKPPVAYVFRMGLFFTTCGTNVSGSMTVERFVKRTKFYGNVKSIVNPRLCLSVFNHYCRVNFPNLKHTSRLDVKPRIALVNHYRRSWSNRFCQMLHKDGVIDSVFKRKFSTTLLKNYRIRVNQYKKLNLL